MYKKRLVLKMEKIIIVSIAIMIYIIIVMIVDIYNLDENIF